MNLADVSHEITTDVDTDFRRSCVPAERRGPSISERALHTLHRGPAKPPRLPGSRLQTDRGGRCLS